MRAGDKRMLSLILAGAVGGVSFPALAGLSWQTVVKDGDTVGSSTYGTPGVSPTQIAVGVGGGVGILGFDSSDDDLFVRTAAAGGTPSVVTLPGGVSGLDNLAITSNLQSGTRMAFVGNSGSSDVGVYEFDSNSPATANAVYVQNAGGIGGTPVTGGGTLTMQVNSSGQVLLPALNTGQAGLLQATGNTPPGQTNSFLYNPVGSSYTLASTANRFAENTDGSGTALLDSGATPGVYNVPAVGVPQAIYAPAAASTLPKPDAIIGSTYNGATGITVFETAADVHNAHSELVLNNGATNFNLGATDGGTIALAGEVTPSGKVAAYVPNGGGGILGYLNGASQTALTTAASTASPSTPLGSIAASALVSDPSNPSSHLVITNLQDALLSPMVNNGGTVVFDALVAPQGSVSTPNQALLEWQPGDASPILLLEAGVSTVQIVGGINSTIDSIYVNALQSEADFYKNSLSDDGYLAIDVTYTNPDSSTGEAVIETQLSAVPEPASLGLLGVGSLVLGMRRRGRHSNGE